MIIHFVAGLFIVRANPAICEIVNVGFLFL